ncbi:hypothetical protein ARMGADRAFT_1065697 [Armillaria gallica]|uniref:Uncharacterized protein n=1 Tax=Armillaria gallica TaxID=47427 RepID=A0A2H3D970_ARMGA|nr:hypothetical protein ARMGADRAFT_1065697 [Armillaria gallica]
MILCSIRQVKAESPVIAAPSIPLLQYPEVDVKTRALPISFGSFATASANFLSCFDHGLAPVGQEPEEEYEEEEEEEEEDDFLFRVLTAPPSRLPISLNQYTGGDFPSHDDSSSNEDYSSSDED